MFVKVISTSILNILYKPTKNYYVWFFTEILLEQLKVFRQILGSISTRAVASVGARGTRPTLKIFASYLAWERLVSIP